MRSNGLRSISGLVALANLAFSNQQYSQALKHYQRSLKECPTCPAEVRLGIGACYFKLGNIKKAEAAYKRTLDIDPGCPHALLGLAVLVLAVGADAETVKQGSQYLAQAFKNDPNDPHILLLLAHFSLQQNLADAAKRLATAALQRASADDVAITAEALCIMGRSSHALGEMEEALKCYRRSLQVNPAQPVAQLGASQIGLLKGDTAIAIKNIENLLDTKPAWTDALRLLAPVCPRQSSAAVSRSVKHFKEAASRDPGNTALWEMLGDAIASVDPSVALNAYAKAIALRREAIEKNSSKLANGDNGASHGDRRLPARLLNNAAVLELRAGNAVTAQSLLAESLASASEGGLQELGPQATVTLGFNVARLREAIGDYTSAEKEYKALLAQFPAYTDCHLRLAYIARARGDLSTAEEWANKALEVSGESARPDVLALLAGLYLDRRELPKAKRFVEELQAAVRAGQGRGTLDAYALIAQGNLRLYSMSSELSRDDAVKQAETQLGKAAVSYWKALKKDPGNIYAANGIGCVMAECGEFSKAKEIFMQVQEAAATTDGFLRIPDAWVNLANSFYGMQRPDASEQTFVSAMKRFKDIAKDSRTLLYLARVQQTNGSIKTALSTVCRAMHTEPNDFRLQFNAAYLMQESACDVLKNVDIAKGEKAHDTLQAALGHLVAAHGIFTRLHKKGRAATGIDEKKLEQHLTFVNMKHKECMEKSESAHAAAERSRLLREENRLRMEAEAKLREVDEKRKAAEEAAVEKQRMALAKEQADKLQRLKMEWKQGATLAKAAAAGDASAVQRGRDANKSKADDALDALFMDDDDEEDFEYVPGQENEHGEGEVGGADALKAAGLLSSEDEEEEYDAAGDEEEEDAGVDIGHGGDDGDRVEDASPAVVSAEKKKSRLKKRERDESSDGGDGIVESRGGLGLDDDEEGEKGGVGEGGHGVEQVKKKARAAIVDSDDD